MFVANGHVYAQLAGRRLHLTYRQPRVLYRNLGTGRFADVSSAAGPAITAENLGRGCAFGDVDNDGDVDIVVNNLDGPPSVLRNDTRTGHARIQVRCVGVKSNRSAIGTRVAVTAAGRRQIAEVMSGSSYYSHSDLRLHFGLGSARTVETIELAWPSGAKETLRDLAVDRRYVVREGEGVVESKGFERS